MQWLSCRSAVVQIQEVVVVQEDGGVLLIVDGELVVQVVQVYVSHVCTNRHECAADSRR